MQRLDVYALIDGERAYQDLIWGTAASSGRPGKGERTIDEFALYLRGYAEDLANIASHELNASKKLAFVRKIAGLAVACMEQHGAPPRVI